MFCIIDPLSFFNEAFLEDCETIITFAPNFNSNYYVYKVRP